jgi:hypothetical protein
VGVTAYVAAGPFIVGAQIKDAMEEQDSERLGQLIDFPVLRQNIKDQMMALLMQAAAEAQTEGDDDAWVGMLMGFSSMMAEQMVESAVTPTSLALAICAVKV